MNNFKKIGNYPALDSTFLFQFSMTDRLRAKQKLMGGSAYDYRFVQTPFVAGQKCRLFTESNSKSCRGATHALLTLPFFCIFSAPPFKGTGIIVTLLRRFN